MGWHAVIHRLWGAHHAVCQVDFMGIPSDGVPETGGFLAAIDAGINLPYGYVARTALPRLGIATPWAMPCHGLGDSTPAMPRLLPIYGTFLSG